MIDADSLWALICDISFWLLVFLLCVQAYLLLFHKGLPNFQTLPAVLMEDLSIITAYRQALSGREKSSEIPLHIVDLGSGNGVLTRYLSKTCHGDVVVGVELSWPAVWLSRLLARFMGLTNLSYVCCDFFTYPLHHVNVVIMYLTTALMPQVAEKLAKECAPDALLISNRFAINHPQLRCVDQRRVHIVGGYWETIYVYQCVSSPTEAQG